MTYLPPTGCSLILSRIILLLSYFSTQFRSLLCILNRISISNGYGNAPRSASSVRSPRFVGLIKYFVNLPILIPVRWLGKTGPRLWADLLHYLPQSKGPNILSDPAPQFKPGAASLPLHKHKHTLSQLTDKCSLPETDILDISRIYNVAAICDECRLHFDIQARFAKTKKFGELHVCPAKDPLHHFRFESSISEPIDISYIKSHPEVRWVDKRVFSCSGQTCPTLITITIRAPILNQQFAGLLVDPKQLQARMVRAQMKCRDTIEKDVELVPVSPFTALNNLCTYIKNAKRGDQRAIHAENLKFLSSLGGDCDVLMKLAGFTYGEEVRRHTCALDLVNN